MAAKNDVRIWTRSFSQADGSNDDNVFRNVSLITIGEAKGHNCQIDDVTLAQLLECSKRFRNGVRANLGHFTGTENSFGYITNIHVEGDKLLGDLNLFEEHPSFSLTKKQINTIPDTMGFSVYFNGPDEVKMIPDADGKEVPVNFARCTELYSSDLVPEPAANPSGVFEKGDSITVDKKESNMAAKSLAETTPDDLKKMISDGVSEIFATHKEHMDEISKKVDDLCSKAEEIGTDDTPIKDKDSGDETKDKDESPMKEKDMAAMEARILNGMLKAMSEQKVAPSGAATVSATPESKALDAKKDEPKFKTFHEAYRAQRALGKGKGESLKLAQDENFDLYKAYCVAQENGETWTREPLEKKTYTALALQGKLR